MGSRTVRLTDYHAKYFAHELTKRCASDSVEKLVAVLADDATAVDAPPEALATDLEQLDELADEWDEEDGEGASVPDRPRLLPEHLQELRQEGAQNRSLRTRKERFS